MTTGSGVTRARLRTLFWFLILNTLLLVPALALPGSMPWLSVEALALWGLLCLGPRRWPGLGNVLTLVYSLLALLVLVDVLVRQSLGRGLNLYLEVGLLDAAWNLLDTNLGPVTAGLALALLIGLLAAVGRLFSMSLERLRQQVPESPLKPLLLAATLALTGVATPLIGSPTLALIAHQAELVTETHQAFAAFSEQLRDQPTTEEAPTPLPMLANRDVILGFLESYGVSTLTDSRYRSVVGQRLEAMSRELAAAGLTVATGRLQSPIQGGQSWLGHLSVLSGHWIHNQLTYETFLSSGLPTLIDDFHGTGHQTLAVMPAITQAWPEGRLLRYGQIYAHDDLDYQGPPFNWVTMPDQYTWHRFQQLREQAPGPLFAELALISSHAPWVPVLPVLEDWDAIGNGRAFERWRDTGEPPVSLWRDPDRVRTQYARAIDYTLAVASGFAARNVGQKTLMILLGDHQPAPLITGDNASRDVVVHVISGDPALVQPFLSGELPGFRLGTRPDLKTAGAPMSRFRPFLHRSFGRH
ncbi:sulfatase [Marinobacter sp. F4218]|uniref:sulfatase n=1 Tax=Marinobacter sp. F4218 TaxID=2862868 RepID=UPI001C62D673|nr:sulfatase [Marinobacter sp. F4218]MBW7471797.1 sulfatase [Marinobacter sp. F4218]